MKNRLSIAILTILCLLLAPVISCAGTHEVHWHSPGFLWFPFGLVGLVIYFLPSIIAILRKKRNVVAIILLNFLFGWSVIGWVITLIWSMTSDR